MPPCVANCCTTWTSPVSRSTCSHVRPNTSPRLMPVASPIRTATVRVSLSPGLVEYPHPHRGLSFGEALTRFLWPCDRCLHRSQGLRRMMSSSTAQRSICLSLMCTMHTPWGKCHHPSSWHRNSSPCRVWCAWVVAPCPSRGRSRICHMPFSRDSIEPLFFTFMSHLLLVRVCPHGVRGQEPNDVHMPTACQTPPYEPTKMGFSRVERGQV